MNQHHLAVKENAKIRFTWRIFILLFSHSDHLEAKKFNFVDTLYRNISLAKRKYKINKLYHCQNFQFPEKEWIATSGAADMNNKFFNFFILSHKNISRNSLYIMSCLCIWPFKVFSIHCKITCKWHLNFFVRSAYPMDYALRFLPQKPSFWGCRTICAGWVVNMSQSSRLRITGSDCK